MTIDRLRYFSAVVETGNLRRASELVGISPPSMSKAISVLEDELGLKLIYTEGRGIGITAEGMDVYHQAIPLLEELRKFHQNLHLKSNRLTTKALRLATFEVFSSYFISSFLQEEPEYQVSLLEMTPGKIEQAILSGLVDLGLTYIPSPDPKLEYLEVGSFQMGIFGKKEWGSVEFEMWPFAIPITELKILTSEIDSLDMWPSKAPKRNVKYRFELLQTALQTTALGLSVLHCPKFVVDLYNQSVKTSHQLAALVAPKGYKLQPPTKVYLVGRKGSIDSKVEGKLARYFRALR